MKELRAEVEIETTPDKIWEVLTDFAEFPEWNPFIRRISGEVRVGSRLEVHIQPPGSRGTTFRPKLLKVEPGRELRWLGRLGIPKLFDGEHIFNIDPLGEDRSRFVQRERFQGVLVPIFPKGQWDRTLRGFERMNLALKARAESRGANDTGPRNDQDVKK